MSEKFDPALKAAWVAALRSGKYAKGRGQLHKPLDGTHCCLGVLYEVVNGPDWTAMGRPLKTPSSSYYYGPPGSCMTDAQANYLAEMNDKSDATFDDIADHIEKHLK